METQVDIDQECTGETGTGQNGEKQEVELLEEREGNGVFPEEQLKKEYIRRVRNILKSKLNGGNIISAINSKAVLISIYGTGIIKWTKNGLEELDRKTRKLMTMYGAQHPKADVNRLYLKRCDVGRG